MLANPIAIILLVVPGLGDQLAPGGGEIEWRQAVRCGPNCLYVMLFMFGKRPDYSQLIDAIDVTERGANAADLVDIAERFGLRLVAIRADASNIDRLPLPAIVHFQEMGDAGHYVMLLRANRDETFTILECTRGDMRKMSRGDFYDLWTGVAMVERGAWNNLWLDRLVALSSAAAAASAFAACVFAWMGRKTPRKNDAMAR